MAIVTLPYPVMLQAVFCTTARKGTGKWYVEFNVLANTAGQAQVSVIVWTLDAGDVMAINAGSENGVFEWFGDGGYFSETAIDSSGFRRGVVLAI